MVMTCRILHHGGLLDQTEYSKSTSLYQSNQDILLDSKDQMRFLCRVTLGQDRDGKKEKMKSDTSKQMKDAERPMIDRELILFLNSRSW